MLTKETIRRGWATECPEFEPAKKCPLIKISQVYIMPRHKEVFMKNLGFAFVVGVFVSAGAFAKAIGPRAYKDFVNNLTSKKNELAKRAAVDAAVDSQVRQSLSTIINSQKTYAVDCVEANVMGTAPWNELTGAPLDQSEPLLIDTNRYTAEITNDGQGVFSMRSPREEDGDLEKLLKDSSTSTPATLGWKKWSTNKDPGENDYFVQVYDRLDNFHFKARPLNADGDVFFEIDNRNNVVTTRAGKNVEDHTKIFCQKEPQ